MKVDFGIFKATIKNAKEIAVTTSALMIGIWLIPAKVLDVLFLE
jgi:hypothetical protein